MSSCGAGGQFVISVHCLLTSKGSAVIRVFMFNKFLGALAANLGSGQNDRSGNEVEAGLFHQRLILRTAAIAAMLNTTRKRCDSHSRWRRVSRDPASFASEWLNEMNDPILTTMMPAGRRLERVYGFGALRRISLSPEVIVRGFLGAQETEDTCREGETAGMPEASPLPTPDTSPGRGIDERDLVGSW